MNENIDFPKYGKIQKLTPKSRILEFDDLVVTEKIHGSNMRVMYSEENELVAGGRNMVFTTGGSVTSNDSFGFVKWLHEGDRWHSLKAMPDYVFYGEFHGPGINKGVDYGPDKDFRVFDVRDPDGEFVPWDDLEAFCKVVQLKTVPVVKRGKIDIEYLESIVDLWSIVGDCNGIRDSHNTWEGVVVKTAKHELDHRGRRHCLKYKSAKWAEKAEVKTKTAMTPEKRELYDRARDFAAEHVTYGRVMTVVDHITRDGNLTLDMTRASEFARTVERDVMAEYGKVKDKEEGKIYRKAIRGTAIKMFRDYLDKLND